MIIHTIDKKLFNFTQCTKRSNFFQIRLYIIALKKKHLNNQTACFEKMLDYTIFQIADAGVASAHIYTFLAIVSIQVSPSFIPNVESSLTVGGFNFL